MLAARKTIIWKIQPYRSQRLRAGTLVTFKWSGLHGVAKGLKIECLRVHDLLRDAAAG